MKKVFTLVLFLVGVTVSAQQVNGNFNAEWVNCTPWDSEGNEGTQGTQPQGWIISNVYGIKSLGATTVGSKEQTSKGDYAVKLTNTPNPMMKNQIIPAYISLGTTWATAKASFTSISDADGGTFGGISFTYKPDGIKLSYKRSHGTAQPTEKASLIAYLWKGTYTQANVPGNTTLLANPTTKEMTDRDRNILGIETATGGTVSKTEDADCLATIEYYIAGDQEEWAELVVPFTYKSTETPEKLNIIISANDYFADRNTIGSGNSLTIDNVELIYNSQLSDLKYNGTTVSGFNKDVYTYNIDEFYTEGSIEAVKNCVGGNYEISSYNEETAAITITVKGDDWSEANRNEHVYTVQFKKALSELASLKYDGTELFEEGKTAFTVDAFYDESKLEVTSNGDKATIEKNYDKETAVLTITIKGEDINLNPENLHTYTVQFNKKGDDIQAIKASEAGQTFDVYTLSGVKVRHNATDLKGLQKGIYIVNGKKYIVR